MGGLVLCRKLLLDYDNALDEINSLGPSVNRYVDLISVSTAFFGQPWDVI